MTAQEFIKMRCDETKWDAFIGNPPTSAVEAMNVLINHFLGEDWYDEFPESYEQTLTVAVYNILKENQQPKDKLRIFLNKIIALLKKVEKKYCE